jgi:16S rRNA (cytosine1402-N4)-methyltransferase
MSYHVPVLLNESIEGLKIQPDGTYVDLTFGGGGHSSEILKRLKNGNLYALDQDENALANNPQDPRLKLIRGNFMYLKNFLKFYGVKEVHGILADLGVSSHHFDEKDRGFSYRMDGPLDMRMNREGKLTAEIVLKEYPEEKLKQIFQEYGEIRNSGKLVSVITLYRKERNISTVQQFLEAIKTCIPLNQENKYLSRVFQALRIEVNMELESLKRMLLQTVDILTAGGRLVVITYHSLEDRLVKNFMRAGNFEGNPEKDFFGKVLTPFRLINNKVIVPTEEEVIKNNRARSAKLRICERI